MEQYLTPADLLAAGLDLRMPEGYKPEPCPPGTHCAITGQPIIEGYRVHDMTGEATAEFLDCFRGGVHGWVSEAAGRCFKNADPRKGNPTSKSFLMFHEGPCHVPLINREAAREQGRACWSDLVWEIWPAMQGRICLIIITTDTKKRLWIRARVGALGCRTPVLLYDGELALNEVRMIDWPRLIECLALVEEVYSAGFSKDSIRECLFGNAKAVKEAGFAHARFMENSLKYWRETPEFLMALLVAQKKEGSS
jgi:hypothetical protein